jgi:hypothetical protein
VPSFKDRTKNPSFLKVLMLPDTLIDPHRYVNAFSYESPAKPSKPEAAFGSIFTGATSEGASASHRPFWSGKVLVDHRLP